MPTPEEPEGDLLAAELALGLLEGEERARAMRRVLADPAFARDVARWSDRFATLFASWPEERPSAALESRIMAGVAPARDAPPAAPGGWRALAIGMSLVAAALLGVVALRPALERPAAPPVQAPARPAPPPLAAAIAPAGATPPVPVFYDPATGALRLAVAERVAPARRSPQLWVLDAAGKPHSLAVLANGRAVTITVPVTLRATVSAGAVLAISIEPAGGAPGDVPTGPVVATGALNRL